MEEELEEMLEIARGDQFSLALEFSDDAGIALDLSDITILFTVKKYLTNADANAEISKDVLPEDHTDPVNGLSAVPLTSEDLDLPGGEYYWSARLKYSNGDLVTVIPSAGGKLKIIDHATKRTDVE